MICFTPRTECKNNSYDQSSVEKLSIGVSRGLCLSFTRALLSELYKLKKAGIIESSFFVITQSCKVVMFADLSDLAFLIRVQDIAL